jgi:DNA modification methylase
MPHGLPEAPGLAIRRVALDTLHLDPANAREHGPENVEAIIGSLKRFGQAEPLVVQKSSGRVVGGNGRLVAMKKLGWRECDIVEVEVDDLTATALGIALNRTSELAAWDAPALAKLLEELKANDALDGIGYSAEDLDKLLSDLEDAAGSAEVDDPGPETPPVDPVTRVGDLWLLGDHRLLSGDSTKPEDVERVMGDEKAILMATDPPYCVDYTGMDRPVHDGKPSGKDWTHVYREVDIKDLGEFLDKVFTAVLPCLAKEAALYVWHAHLQQPVIAETFERHGLNLHQVLVWVKPVGTFGHSYYRWRHEPCAFGWRRGHKPKHGYGAMDTVWEVDWDGKARITTFHPTSKPPRLFEIPMEQHTRPEAVVLEPFAGSGSQLIAAERLRRRVKAIEISPAFVDGTIRRWEKATGKEALLHGTEMTFAEVAPSSPPKSMPSAFEDETSRGMSSSLEAAEAAGREFRWTRDSRRMARAERSEGVARAEGGGGRGKGARRVSLGSAVAACERTRPE